MRWLPHTYDEKAEFIRGKALPKALYGGEVAHCNETAVKTLQTAIVDVVAPTTALRSPSLVLALLSRGDDLDPVVNLSPGNS